MVPWPENGALRWYWYCTSVTSLWPSTGRSTSEPSMTSSASVPKTFCQRVIVIRGASAVPSITPCRHSTSHCRCMPTASVATCVR